MYECDDNSSTPPAAAHRPVPRLPPVPPFNSLEEWKGQLFWKAMDPIGYQYLCRILGGGKPEDVQLIFSELKDQICALMFDRLGGNVVISLCHACNEQQMNHLVSSVTADVDLFLVVCLNSDGSRCIKDFLRCLRTPKQISDVVSVLRRLTPRLVNHDIGSRVISRCLDIFPLPAEETKPILDVISDIFFEMATNRTGCSLLRELLLGSDAFVLENQTGILSKIKEDLRKLSHHPCGRTLVWLLIKLRIQDVEKDLVAQLRGGFALMSMDRYASQVVLILMEEYKEKVAPQIYDEIIHSRDCSRVLLHPDGKSVLKYAKKHSMKSACQTLNQQIPLRANHHGKNVHPKNKTQRICV
ncbi:pumilio homolog 12-like [Henckelia pumila]|uniref:pumilio homolog 12-like n=1 Tax=Henckelia pumila TaxID=405737 RepID=UPI003C6E8263